MLRKILSIAGKPGLYRLVSQGKNMLIVESLTDAKRTPVYARDKVMSLGDISMYTVEADVPLAQVMQQALAVTEGKPVDIKGMADADLREEFAKVLPDFDRERVYTTDIRKFFQWYNALLAAGFTAFVEADEAADEAAPAADATEEKAE